MGGVGGSSKAKRPIGVKFEIPYFTTSGIQVRYLKIIEPKVSIYRLVCLSIPYVGLLTAYCIVTIPIIALGTIHHPKR